jgi:hypothetical protein
MTVYRKRFVLFQEYVKNRNIENTSSPKIQRQQPSPKKGEGKSYCRLFFDGRVFNA